MEIALQKSGKLKTETQLVCIGASPQAWSNALKG